MNALPIKLIDKTNGNHYHARLTQTITIQGSVPKRKDRQLLIQEYLRKMIQPGIIWSRQQAERFAKRKERINYASKGMELFDSKFGLK